jgi:hypothetical protein
VKDYLLMEEEFVKNQERMKPTDDKSKEELNKVPHYFDHCLCGLESHTVTVGRRAPWNPHDRQHPRRDD